MQKKVFGVLMAVFMVYGMEVYNAALRQGGFAAGLLLPPWQALLLVPLVLAVEACFGGPAAGWLQGRLARGKELSPRGRILLRQLCTVLFMCPAMSLAAVFIFKGGLQPEFWRVWGETILTNAPMALLWQVLAAGPAVRFLVGLLPEGGARPGRAA